MCLTVCLRLCLCLCLCLSVNNRSIGGLPVCLRLPIRIYKRLHLRSVHLCLFVSVYSFAFIHLLIAFVYLSASIVCLFICEPAHETWLSMALQIFSDRERRQRLVYGYLDQLRLPAR